MNQPPPLPPQMPQPMQMLYPNMGGAQQDPMTALAQSRPTRSSPIFLLVLSLATGGLSFLFWSVARGNELRSPFSIRPLSLASTLLPGTIGLVFCAITWGVWINDVSGMASLGQAYLGLFLLFIAGVILLASTIRAGQTTANMVGKQRFALDSLGGNPPIFGATLLTVLGVGIAYLSLIVWVYLQKFERDLLSEDNGLWAIVALAPLFLTFAQNIAVINHNRIVDAWERQFGGRREGQFLQEGEASWEEKT